jgi:predicted ArsR family transcriptional regulator
MAELTITTVISSIKEIADAIERLRNPSDIDLLKLRLDYISRMLVTLDIPEEIVNIMSSVHQQLERINYSPDVQYHAPLTYTQGRGRPKIDISREQLAFLVDQGFTAGEMSGVLGVGKRTVQRRLAALV